MPSPENLSEQLVSVVVPAHNEGVWLQGALDSLLAQTHQHLDIIVVDDGSRDTTPEEAAKYKDNPRVRLFRFETTRGEGAARGKGLAEARGAFTVQVDADATFPTDFIERGLGYFAKNSDLVAIALGYLEVHPAQRGVIADYFRAKREASHRIRLVGGKDEIASFFMYRTSVRDSIGNYDASVPGGTDLDFGKRIKKSGLKYSWARDMFFRHADPASWDTFTRRTFNGSVYWKEIYKRYGMWPRGSRLATLIVRSIFVTLLPLYIVLAFWNPWWLIIAAAAFALEGILPLIVDSESRLMLKIALKQKWWKLALLLPLILFIRLRASAYGKLYATFFPARAKRAVTFDV